MFFESLEQVPNLAERTNFSIFALNSFEVEKIFKKTYKTNALFLKPDEKSGKISIEMVRDFVSRTNSADEKDRFFIVLNAETMNPPAENAFLKNLEEPKPHHHFVLATKTPSALLPTVLSRAQVYYLKETGILKKPVESSEKIKNLAKQLIVADPKKLIELANNISKHKDNPRTFALEIVGTAIEIMYKSYFATNQEKFLKKLPNLLKLYDSLERNGHLKLHIVADML